jgi:type II secretory pathway predicted ATPase ExeA
MRDHRSEKRARRSRRKARKGVRNLLDEIKETAMYYEYWGMQKAPFDNVPDPSMYVESHSAVENAIAETLFAIEEGNECVAVIVGDIGSGKTLSLRLILDSLQQDKYRIAFITNPDMSFVHLLREIIGQITGRECEAKFKVDLLERFNKLLFETHDQGKKVLIFVDEANAITPSNLESLRLLTNMQDDSRNLFTMVLAGQMEFAKRLEHPRRANLFQRIGTYNRIGKIESVEKLKDYVATRIRLAGGRQMLFSDAAVEALWEHSEHGVPRLVNKICKLCLKAGETNSFEAIDEEVVNQIGERFRKQVGPVERREMLSRKATNSQGDHAATEQSIEPVRKLVEERDESHVVSPLRSTSSPFADESSEGEEETRNVSPLRSMSSPLADVAVDAEEEMRSVGALKGMSSPLSDEPLEAGNKTRSVTPLRSLPSWPAKAVDAETEDETRRVIPMGSTSFPFAEESLETEDGTRSAIPLGSVSSPFAEESLGVEDRTCNVSPLRGVEPKTKEEHQHQAEPTDASWETDIGPFRVKIAIPFDILQQAGTSTSETRTKIAGSLAAQTLQRYPQMAFSSSHDPVALWGDITKSILNAFDRHSIAAGQ